MSAQSTPDVGFDAARATTSEREWAALPWQELRAPEWVLGAHDRLLVLSAHPDDETLGAAGLIASALARGLEVEVVVATAGEASHPRSPTVSREELAKRRLAELVSAMSTLGGARTRCLHLPDGDLTTLSGALEKAYVELVASLAPEPGEASRLLVLAPWTDDRHPDHEAVGRAACEVARAAGVTLLQYPVWLWQWGDRDDVPWDRAIRHDLPAVVRQRKRAATSCHVSQVRPLSTLPGDEPVVGQALLAAASRPFEVFWMDDPDHRVGTEMDGVHRRADDPWAVGSRWYERRKRAVTLASLPRERYRRVIEVGCSVGALTADLSTRADHVAAVDVSAQSLERARTRLDREVTSGRVTLHHQQVPQQWPVVETVDLIVVSEVGYFLSARSWAALLERCLSSLAPGGVRLACHWRGDPVGWPLTGDQIHDDLAADERWEMLVDHREDRFRLHVLTPSRAGVAR